MSVTLISFTNKNALFTNTRGLSRVAALNYVLLGYVTLSPVEIYVTNNDDVVLCIRQIH